MRVHSETIELSTPGRGLFSIQRHINEWLRKLKPTHGSLTVFIQHTSASLIIQENADPDVQRDLESFFSRLVRDGDPLFVHTAEGPDDMPSHIRAALTQTSIAIPIVNGHPALGTWQGVYVYEHRTSPHRRRILLQYLGD